MPDHDHIQGSGVRRHWEIDNFMSAPEWTDATCQGAWVAFGGGYNAPGYLLDEWGFVHLRGLAKSGVVGSGTPIFTLPPLYRPAAAVRFAVVSNGAFGAVDVLTTGAVSCVVGNNTHVSLDGISFYAG